MTDISCLCGAVKVHMTGEPITQFYCHCEDCRATSGGAYIGVAIYPAKAIAVLQGQLTTWTLKTLPRQRCAVCGTPVMAIVPDRNECGIMAHLLPPGAFQPEYHLYCEEAILPVQDDLPHFKEYPAEFGGSGETVDW